LGSDDGSSIRERASDWPQCVSDRGWYGFRDSSLASSMMPDHLLGKASDDFKEIVGRAYSCIQTDCISTHASSSLDITCRMGIYEYLARMSSSQTEACIVRGYDTCNVQAPAPLQSPEKFSDSPIPNRRPDGALHEIQACLTTLRNTSRKHSHVHQFSTHRPRNPRPSPTCYTQASTLRASHPSSTSPPTLPSLKTLVPASRS